MTSNPDDTGRAAPVDERAAMVAAFNSMTGLRWQGDTAYQEALWIKAWQARASLPTEADKVDAERVLSGLDRLFVAAFDHWDNDRDAKVGKLLAALIGNAPGYDYRADAFRKALDDAIAARQTPGGGES